MWIYNACVPQTFVCAYAYSKYDGILLFYISNLIISNTTPLLCSQITFESHKAMHRLPINKTCRRSKEPCYVYFVMNEIQNSLEGFNTTASDKLSFNLLTNANVITMASKLICQK